RSGSSKGIALPSPGWLSLPGLVERPGADSTAAAHLIGLSLAGRFERRDVDLLHFHHGEEGALRRLRLRVPEELHDPERLDLPREAELVLEPPARPRARIAAR